MSLVPADTSIRMHPSVGVRVQLEMLAIKMYDDHCRAWEQSCKKESKEFEYYQWYAIGQELRVKFRKRAAEMLAETQP